MIHGAQSYFREVRRNGRRVVAATLTLHLLALGGFLATRIPAVREALTSSFRPIVRFGYEGPDREVETIVLSARSGARAPLVDIGEVRARPARRGGDGVIPADRAERERSRHLGPSPGAGEDDINLFARARARQASVPLVQSSELVIESMIEPVYPEILLSRGVEGRVALMALVDTAGRVVEMSIVGGSGYTEFEESAMDAVRLARFRPYRAEGKLQEVYALIRYRFTLN